MAGVICNTNAEIALLGSIILDEKLIIKCIDECLKPSDFTVSGLDGVYQAMLGLHKSKKPIEMTSLIEEYKNIGGTLNISDITAMTSRSVPSNIDYYISEVREKAYKRDIADKLKAFTDEIESIDSNSIKSNLEDICKSIDSSNSVENLFCNAAQIKREDLNAGLETGFSDLDSLLNGLVYGSLTVLTGEPSSGKSTLLNQVIAQNIMNGHRTLIYSGELTGFNVLQWFMRTVANPNDLKEFKNKIGGSYYDVTSQGEDLIRKWIQNKLYLFSEDVTPSIDNLLNSIDYLARTQNIKLVVLDNMMTIDNGNLEEYEKQKVLAKKLKSIARKYKLCVILVAHPKKKLGSDRKYHMHDVSGASEVVNLADYELLLTREIKHTEDSHEDITKIGILKNRITGRQGISKRLNFDEMRKRFWIHSEERNKNYKYDEMNQVTFVEVKEVESEDVPF
ncbi:DnaB-like helicase C-terminal domain-containing protein [Peptostreptococcus equinus]|uniref:DNA 5'-3' helicase n=1 Tax=Peptostreptococcus equinus TaxID=3003601 RepID=A0ABY7JPE9_9FIRM|nr:DnaB-like helicase C-terminal domain-containing protein [Peptostreptococcus sp. CBA3647]WAW14766.1 AAA family ATPase [Peptostreptococcus sp. CBA3647]